MKIFVYGSLKSGCSNHKYLEKSNSKFVGESIIFGYSLYNLGPFPGMIKSSNSFEMVHGETYEVDEKTLKLIDNLEGNGRLYKRKAITVFIGFIPFKAYTYIYLHSIYNKFMKVENNNWMPNQCKTLKCYKKY